jgi:hypothetical protein
VTLEEWIRHYEEVSCSIDSDDYFGTMIASTWAHLKQKMPDGSKVPVVKFTPRADVDLLEKQLKKSIYEKTPPNTNVKARAPPPASRAPRLLRSARALPLVTRARRPTLRAANGRAGLQGARRQQLWWR